MAQGVEDIGLLYWDQLNPLHSTKIGTIGTIKDGVLFNMFKAIITAILIKAKAL